MVPVFTETTALARLKSQARPTSEVLPASDMAAHVASTAERIASLAPQAARLNKQTLRALAAGDWQAPALAAPFGYAASAEHREGIAAFVGKRKPLF